MNSETLTRSYPTVEGFEPLSESFLNNPMPMIHKAQQQAPVFYYEPLKMWVITRHEDICNAARDWQTFSSRALSLVPPPAHLAHKIPPNIAQESFIGIDPPEHTHDRTSVAPIFNQRAVEKYNGDIRRIANELIDSFAHKGECEFMYEFAYPLALRVIMLFLKVPTERADDYRRWTNDLFSMLSPKKMAKPMSDAEREERWSSLVECFEFFEELVKDREANPQDDFLSRMLTAKDADGNPAVARSRALLHTIETIAAGNDTTPNLMAAMMQFLDANPDQRALLDAQPDLMAGAVEETLRIRGTSPGLFRVTTRDVEIGGTTIPAGEAVWLLFVAGGLDATKFPDPEKYDIRRQNAKEHLAFGYGRHLCLGSPLARLEIRIGMEELFKRLPDIHVVKNQKLSYLPVLTVLILEKLHCQFTAAGK